MTPIEQMFWDAANICMPWALRIPTLGLSIADLERALADEPGASCVIAPQVVCGRYRVDFMALGRIGFNACMAFAVECDGHEFHEKTKEQAQRDKLRDRELVRDGIRVLRFTGSEIWRSPEMCAHEVYVSIVHHSDHDWVQSIESPPHAWEAMKIIDQTRSGPSLYVARTIYLACDKTGRARVSPEFLKQSVRFLNLSDPTTVLQDLRPLIECRAVDTKGRLVFQFNEQAVRS